MSDYEITTIPYVCPIKSNRFFIVPLNYTTLQSQHYIVPLHWSIVSLLCHGVLPLPYYAITVPHCYIIELLYHHCFLLNHHSSLMCNHYWAITVLYRASLCPMVSSGFLYCHNLLCLLKTSCVPLNWQVGLSCHFTFILWYQNVVLFYYCALLSHMVFWGIILLLYFDIIIPFEKLCHHWTLNS